MSTMFPRTVYESPEGRVTVVREGGKKYVLYGDGTPIKSYEYAFQAEHAGGVWLHEQAAQLTVDLADEQVNKDTEAVPVKTVICEDTVNALMLGKPLGTEFLVGEGDDEVMMYISDTDENYYHIDVFMGGQDPIHIEDLERWLPALSAILADPRFQAARAAKEAEWAAEKAA